MRATLCPNFNHRRTNPPVGFCPSCGQVVNDRIAIKRCTADFHASARTRRTRYCVHCGERLIDS